MEKLIPSFKDTILNEDVVDIVSDVAEIGIDSVLENELLKSIPIVKLFLGVGKWYLNIQERNFITQLVSFINSMNSKEISEEEISKYLKKLENPIKMEKELGRLLIILNRTIDKKKSEWLGNLFRNYIKTSITWAKFVELAQIIEQIFLEDIEFLLKVLKGDIKESSKANYVSVSRLKGLGLINTTTKSINPRGDRLVTDELVYISSLGQTFLDSIR